MNEFSAYVHTFLLVAWASIEAIVVVIVALQLRLAWRRYAWKNDKTSQLSFDDTPTISVCIPARNETFALSQCLDAVLASDYPKLEIIVLDDCSQDNTSQLIRSFAHAGVRFIQGETPPEGWLGRNYAIHTLSRAASGKYMVFMGVDTRMSPKTITKLANYMYAKRASMVSVLPPREHQVTWSGVFSTFRYFWQLLLPQFLHIPAASALWMIRADAFSKVGGMEPLKNDVLPENVLAQQFAVTSAYRFLVGDDDLGVTYMKKWSSQFETGIRQYFPALGKKIGLVLLALIGIFIVAVLPFGFVAAGLAGLVIPGWLFIGSLLVSGSFAALYALFGRYVLRQPFILTFLAFPLLLVQEIAVIVASAYAYKTGRVNWKDRNICYPVLRR